MNEVVIKKVHYLPIEGSQLKRIEAVELVELNVDDTDGRFLQVDKESLIQLTEKFPQIFAGSQEVHRFLYGNEYFCRIDKNVVPGDDLGDLPDIPALQYEDEMRRLDAFLKACSKPLLDSLDEIAKTINYCNSNVFPICSNLLNRF